MFTTRSRSRAALAATAAVGLFCLAGCGSEPAPAAEQPPAETPTAESSATPAVPPSAAPTTDVSATPTPAPTEAPTQDAGFNWGGPLAPGAFGRFKAEGDVRTLVAEGVMARDTHRESMCDGTFWKWSDELGDGVDVLTDQQGRIVSFGMSEPLLETAEGITVGDTLLVLNDVYGPGSRQTNDYGQTTWVVQDGDRWIGFVLSGKTRESKIEFIEVSVGSRPGLLRDGC